MADRVGFEPTEHFCPPHFKCGAIDRLCQPSIFGRSGGIQTHGTDKGSSD